MLATLNVNVELNLACDDVTDWIPVEHIENAYLPSILTSKHF